MNMIKMYEVHKMEKLPPYVSPAIDIISLGSRQSLLENFSLGGGFDEWELGEEALDLEPGN